MTDIKSLTYPQLEEFLISLEEPKFRAKQIFAWLYRGVTSFDEMTDISKQTREKLAQRAYISFPAIEEKHVSKIDGTVKYLYRLRDGEFIETVIMQYKHGITACVSSQVGCRQGCAFCASTIGGLVRDLTAGEIADQIIFSSKDLGKRIDNIVMMGIGEPLDNFENVVKFLKNINDKNGLNIGMRHISLSTCGIVPMIDKLAELDLQLTLSVSLHAPDAETRSKIMPVNRKYPLDTLIDACRRYYSKTGRRISFEYALISGVNDSREEADKLGELLKGMGAHVNLIPVNPVKERHFEKPDKARTEAFVKYLEQKGIVATVRRRLGADIEAACGQLRRNRNTNKE